MFENNLLSAILLLKMLHFTPFRATGYTCFVLCTAGMMLVAVKLELRKEIHINMQNNATEI